jgi:hypothetical protein
MVQAGLRIKGEPISKLIRTKNDGGMAQVAELPNQVPSPKFNPQFHQKKEDTDRKSGSSICNHLLLLSNTCINSISIL